MGVCLCFCPVPAMGESGLSAWPVYPDLWIRCAADPDDDIFCAASCGCGLFCWHDRSNDPGIWDWHRAGSVVSYPALGLLSCGLELPGIYFGDFLRFLGALAVVLVTWIHPFFSSIIQTWPAWALATVCLLLLTLEGVDLISLI